MAVIFGDEGGDGMIRCRVAILCLLAAAIAGVGGWATGFSGTLGAQMAFLPTITGDVWFDLDWDLDGWGAGMSLECDVLPAFAVSWTGTVDATLGPVDLRATTAIDVVPFGLAGLDLYAGIGLLDLERGEFSAAIDASLLVDLLPAFGTTWSLGADLSYGVVSIWADVDLTVPGLDTTILTGAEVRVLALDLEDGDLTVDLGASTVLLPNVDARFWFDVGLRLGVVTVTAETEFELTPFGLADQRIEASLPFDGLTIAAWFGFTGAGDPTAGIYVTYGFPSSIP